MPRLKTSLRWSGLVIAGLFLIAVAGACLFLRASLPRTDGRTEVPGLAAEVEVSRDSLGIPVIRAESLEDAVRAQGYVHAQDHFFLMDLLRRYNAGEVAALLGNGAPRRTARPVATAAPGPGAGAISRPFTTGDACSSTPAQRE